MVTLLHFIFAPTWLSVGTAFGVDIAMLILLFSIEDEPRWIDYLFAVHLVLFTGVGIYFSWLHEWSFLIAGAIGVVCWISSQLTSEDKQETQGQVLKMLTLLCLLWVAGYGFWLIRSYLLTAAAAYIGLKIIHYWITHADFAYLAEEPVLEPPEETLARLDQRFIERTGQASDIAVMVAKGLLWLAGIGIVLTIVFFYPLVSLAWSGAGAVVGFAYMQRCNWGQKKVDPITTDDLLKGVALTAGTLFAEYILWNYFYSILWLLVVGCLCFLTYRILLYVTRTTRANPEIYMQHVFDKQQNIEIQVISFVALYLLDVVVNFFWVFSWVWVIGVITTIFSEILSWLGSLSSRGTGSIGATVISATGFFIIAGLLYRFYLLPILLALGLPRLEEIGESNNFRHAMRKGVLGGLPATLIEHEKINAMLDRIEERAKALNVDFVRPRFIYMKDELGDNAFVTSRSLYVGRNLFISPLLGEAVLAHEVGHMVFGHGAYRAGVAAFFSVTLIEQIRQILKEDVSGKDKSTNFFMFFFNAPISLSLWVHRLLMRHTYREQEYAADMYATVLGYGNSLASRLSTFGDRLDTSIQSLAEREHPYNRERIVMIEAALDGQESGTVVDPLNFMQFADAAEAINAEDYPMVALASPVRFYKKLKAKADNPEEADRALNLQTKTIFPKWVIAYARAHNNDSGLQFIAKHQQIEE